MGSNDNPGGKIGRRIGRFFSWLAGLSIGSVVLLILFTLIGITIFVRTDFFQNSLRDRVISEVQSNLGLEISYESATVNVFRIYPRLNFNKVQLLDPKTKNQISVDRVSISISMFLSLPLLFVNEIYLSSAEISGLDYELTDPSVVGRWVEKLKPKKSLLPTSFRTVIGKIFFQNFGLKIGLNKIGFLKEDLRASLFLNNFSVQVGEDDLALAGDLRFEGIEYGNLKLPEGEIKLRDAIYKEEFTKIGSLLVLSGEDKMELSGKIKNWENPELDIATQLSLNLENYNWLSDLSGNLLLNTVVKGTWRRPIGKASFSASNIRYHSKLIEKIQSVLELKNDRIKIQNFDWSSGEETGSLKGDFGLGDIPSDLQAELNKVSLESYLGLIAPDLANWKLLGSGSLSLKGGLSSMRDIELSSDFKMQSVEIRKASNADLVFQPPEGELKLAAQFAELNAGELQFSYQTLSSVWDGKGSWDPNGLNINWDSQFDGEMGQLFMFHLIGKGNIKGSLSGPSASPIIKAQPNLVNVTLNEIELNNLRGDVEFANRKLTATNVQAEGVQVSGGLFFPDGPKAKTQFSDFEFQIKDVPIAKIFSSLRHTKEWVKPLGTVSGSGILNDWVFSPVGSGNFLAKDLGFGGDPTQGRIAKANWSFEEGIFYLKDIFVQTSRKGGGVKGAMSFVSSGVREFKLQGSRVRLSDWLLLIGRESPVQSLANFEMSYDEGTREFESDFQFIETLIASRIQKPSRLKIFATDDSTRISLSLFESAILMSLNSRAAGGKADVLIQGLELGDMNRSLQRNGISLNLNGDGKCDFKWVQGRERKPVFQRFVEPPSAMNCDIQLEKSQMKRATNILHSLDPFSVSIQQQASGDLRFSSAGLNLRTGKKNLQMSGYYESANNLRLKMNGETSLESISYFLPFLSRSEGSFSIDGIWKEDGFSGSVALAKSLLVLEDSPIIVRNLSANLQASASNFRINKLDGEIQDGSLEASGEFKLDGLDVRNAMIGIQLNNPLFEPQKGIRFRAQGPLRLFIQNSSASLGGQVNLTEGSFRKRINLRGDLLKLFQPKNKDFDFYEKKQSYLDTWKLNVGVKTLEPFSVRNNIAEGSANLDMNIGGTIGKPVLSGSVSIVEGSFNYFNRDFIVRSGSVQFLGIQENIPRYDIRAEAEIDEYRVSLNFQGDKDQQKIIYSSDPPLTEKQILALVSYGTPPTDENNILQDDPTISAAFTGISFFTGALQDKIEGALSSDLGIRRFNLYPAFYDETGRTELQLTIGSDLIKNRLLLNYSNFVSTSGGHQIELDLKVNRAISLVGSWRDTQNDQSDSISGDFGGDLIFRFEFE